MKLPTASSLAPSDRVRDLEPMVKAMQRAVREAIESHRLAGHPIVVWKDEKVVWIRPEDIPVLTPDVDGPKK